MQSVIVLGLVGLIYAAVASIVATVYTGTVEYRARSIQRVEQMFEDVEFAINNIILKQEITLTNSDYLDDGGNDLLAPVDLSGLSSLVPWSKENLINDPWETPLEIYTAAASDAFSTIYSDGSGNTVIAPIQSFALVSYGPNKVLDTVIGNNLTYRDILSIEPVGDDIIRTFSTREAMNSIWSKIYFELDNSIIPAISDNYKQQQDMFMPVIEFAYEELIKSADAGEADTFIANWQNYGDDTVANILPAPVNAANMHSYIGGKVFPEDGLTYYFPNLDNIDTEALGLNGITSAWDPFTLSLEPSIAIPITDEEIGENSKSLILNVDIDTFNGGTGVGEWDISFQVVVEGSN